MSSLGLGWDLASPEHPGPEHAAHSSGKGLSTSVGRQPPRWALPAASGREASLHLGQVRLESDHRGSCPSHLPRRPSSENSRHLGPQLARDGSAVLPHLPLPALGDTTGQHRVLSYWVTGAPVDNRWGRHFVLPTEKGAPLRSKAGLVDTPGALGLVLPRAWWGSSSLQVRPKLVHLLAFAAPAVGPGALSSAGKPHPQVTSVHVLRRRQRQTTRPRLQIPRCIVSHLSNHGMG